MFTPPTRFFIFRAAEEALELLVLAAVGSVEEEDAEVAASPVSPLDVSSDVLEDDETAAFLIASVFLVPTVICTKQQQILCNYENRQ